MEKVKILINQLREKVKEYFSKDVSGHKIDHLERTLKYALQIQAKEGGDIIVVAVSAFVHDVHRVMQSEKGNYVTPKESLPIVEKLIADLDITEAQKQHILYAVEHHEEYAFAVGGVTVTDIESKILQDADNIDAIGAVGIERALHYGYAYNSPTYDPSVPLYQDVYDNSKNDASTIHHIQNKLIRLMDYMNTKTAKKIAKKKTRFMKQFMDLYIEESSTLF